MTHGGEDSLYIRPSSYRWQASRRIALPRPVNSPVVLSFVHADKRDLSAVGGWCGLARAVSIELEPAAAAARRTCGFTLMKLALFSLPFFFFPCAL